MKLFMWQLIMIMPKLPKIQILQEILHVTHLLKLLDKMYKYEMDPTRTVGATERTQDAGLTDGETDGVKPTYPPTTLCGRYKKEADFVLKKVRRPKIIF